MIKIPGMLMIGASGRGVGKTPLTCVLIERFGSQHDIVGGKISTVDGFNQDHHPDVAHAAPYRITEEKDRRGETDTSRMLAAGAQRVFWLEVLDTHLEEGVTALLETLGHSAVLVCESNRARRIVEPGAFVMIKGSQDADWKPSAEEVAQYADKVVFSGDTRLDADLDDIQLAGGRWAVKMQATAIILAGGAGVRMGQDKTMLPIEDTHQFK